MWWGCLHYFKLLMRVPYNLRRVWPEPVWRTGRAGGLCQTRYPVFIKLFVPSVLAPLWNFRSLVSRTHYAASLQHRNLSNSSASTPLQEL